MSFDSKIIFSSFRYNQWSPPAQSNETSNGYFLERSHSARITLDKSYELCPEEDQEGEESIGGGVGGSVSGGLGSEGNENDTIVHPPPPLADDANVSAMKSSQQQSKAALSVTQARPGHAQVTTPRATAPPNPSLTMPRSSLSLSNSNRPQQLPAKNDGSGNVSNSSQSGSSPASH